MRHGFDELVGEEPEGRERERLRHAHDLLVAAGPPAELPAHLHTPPRVTQSWRREPGDWRPRRRFGAALVLAGALLLGTFGGGYLVGHRAGSFSSDYVVTMRGTEAAPRALATLVVGAKDEAGNWPMELRVQGLPPLPRGQWYELRLTRDGRPVESCGVFRAQGRTVTYLNAPFRLRQFDGWIVTRRGSERVLMRTPEV